MKTRCIKCGRWIISDGECCKCSLCRKEEERFEEWMSEIRSM